jgi:hypothetical protein
MTTKSSTRGPLGPTPVYPLLVTNSKPLSFLSLRGIQSSVRSLDLPEGKPLRPAEPQGRKLNLLVSVGVMTPRTKRWRALFSQPTFCFWRSSVSFHAEWRLPPPTYCAFLYSVVDDDERVTPLLPPLVRVCKTRATDAGMLAST